MPNGVRIRTRNEIWKRICRFFTGGETWTHHHLNVFALTFVSFAFVHATRKTLSTVKPSMIATWTRNTTGHPPLFPSEQAASEFLALLDGGFLFTYAIGLFFGGVVGDTYDPKVVLSIGMALSAISVFIFGYVTELLHWYTKFIYLSLWLANGLFQSVAWPAEISIVGNWFGHNSRGVVLGVWSGCASVGNIVGTLIASRVILLGYQYAFAVNSVLLFVCALFVLLYLKSAPRDVGLPEPAEVPDEQHRVIEVHLERPRPINFWRAWLLPGVIPYSLAYACLKLVNYGFFFWLPFYLSSAMHWSEADADALSIWYDVGGIIAAIIAGAVSDHFPTRTPIIVGMLAISNIFLYMYSVSPPVYFVNALILSLAGFFVAGPGNMISSVVTADLGKCPELRGNAEALSTVTGIVDGTGSLGAAFGQLLIPSIEVWFGWVAIFYGFMFMIVCTILCLVPLLYKECRDRRRLQYVALNSDAYDSPSESDDVLPTGPASEVIDVRRRPVQEGGLAEL
ncbi:hypothetical protein WR25_24108 [Diploscapter pachys]|uniref:Sugar phosphate exchanger 3 n=1 Tax=Diploscapter pachys TaxID=2018661 RepID=A0A2A2J4S7_9BILA|nr:hypothetical protein WR25_24108 [Diploscapter pachys]